MDEHANQAVFEERRLAGRLLPEDEAAEVLRSLEEAAREIEKLPWETGEEPLK